MSTLVEEEIDEKVIDTNSKQIIIYNDDINTFQFVIACLIKYCKHHPHQAEQCSLMIHHNGKAQVKVGDYDTLEPICVALTDKGLNAKIE